MSDGAAAPSAIESVEGDLAVVDLAAGRYTARFLPGVGMTGTSLTFDGEEHVHLTSAADLRAGHTTGLPLLHPWANRLSRFTYEVDGLWVDLEDTPPVHVLDGLPIHGTMVGTAGWRVEAVLADSLRALLQARFVFGEHPDHLRSFPFPHELVVFVELSDLGLRVTTEILNTGTRPVPVSFGWHPYVTLPGVARADVAVVLPERERLELDGRGIPTGGATPEAESVQALGSGEREVTYDHGYRLSEQVPTRRLAIEAQHRTDGPRRRLTVELDEAYGYAQVYAPSGKPFVALEPMTAPTDALVTGQHRTVAPGERTSATFVVRIEDVAEGTEPDDDV